MKNNNSNQILDFDKDLESYIFNSAKYYALKLIRNGFYSFYEVNDLEQEARSRCDASLLAITNLLFGEVRKSKAKTNSCSFLL